MRQIGFSHGVLFKMGDVYTAENVQRLLNCGCNAIEVNYHHAKEFPLLINILSSVQNFDYKSIHAPVDVRYKDDQTTRELLEKIENFYHEIKAKLVVVHPGLVDDWRVFNNFKVNWAIENMDDRQINFKNTDDLIEFFNQYDNWNLVLDLGHCNANDKTMTLAEDFIPCLKEKIKEIHLSGYKVFHDPLYKTQQTEIIKYCKKIDVPIIIESVFEIDDGVTGIQKEFDYVMENLK